MPQYEKGHPGGPGRPRGSRNAVNRALDALAAEGAETVVRKMVELAEKGDPVAARLLLNRIWTIPRGRPVDVDLPPINGIEDVLVAHGKVLNALVEQTISPAEGQALCALLETHRRAFETLRHESLITALEREREGEL